MWPIFYCLWCEGSYSYKSQLFEQYQIKVMTLKQTKETAKCISFFYDAAAHMIWWVMLRRGLTVKACYVYKWRGRYFETLVTLFSAEKKMSTPKDEAGNWDHLVAWVIYAVWFGNKHTLSKKNNDCHTALLYGCHGGVDYAHRQQYIAHASHKFCRFWAYGTLKLLCTTAQLKLRCSLRLVF